MKKATRFVGLDVHAETIAVAIAEPGRGGEVRAIGTIPNRPEAVRELVQKLGGAKGIQVCYEAGPTGYTLYWQLTELGVDCDVVAPTLVPVKAGDRVKPTDATRSNSRVVCGRASSPRCGYRTKHTRHYEISFVLARPPRRDQLRARYRMSRFLLRAGQRPPDDIKPWSLAYVEWLRKVRFEHPARQATMVDYLGEIDLVRERIG